MSNSVYQPQEVGQSAQSEALETCPLLLYQISGIYQASLETNKKSSDLVIV